MRRLGLLVLPILVLAFPVAANADWQGGTQWDHGVHYAPDQVGFDRFNTGLLYGVLPYAPEGRFGNSVDGGATWNVSASLPPDGEHFDVGIDRDGNRIWAYSISDKIAVARPFGLGLPGETATTRYFDAPGVSDLKLSVGANGDALIGWSNENGDPGVAFWKAGQDSPGPAQILSTAAGCGVSSTPTPFLDPGRSATFAWTCDGATVHQASADDASVPVGFDSSEQLADGAIIKSDQAPDGRAVLLLSLTEAIPENSYGVDTARSLKYTSRVAGSGFNSAKVLAGGGDTNAYDFADRIVVAPNGRVLAGFSTYENIPSPNYFCGDTGETSPYKPASAMAEGTIDPGNGDLTLKTTVLSEPGLTGAWVTHVAVGPDGRFALAHGGTSWCGVNLRPSANETVLLALDGQNFSEIPNPYKGMWSFRAFTFTARGQLFITAQNAIAGYPRADFYDTSAPLEPAVHSAPSTPAGDVDAKRTPSATVRPRIKLVAVSILKRGKLLVTLDSNVAGKFSAILASGKTTLARASAKAKSGSTKLQIRLNSKAAKQLKKTGRLNAKLVTSFTPVSGAAPSQLTKHLTFTK